MTADEILLADGLAVGDGVAEQRGGTTEWDLAPLEEDEIELSDELEQLVPDQASEPEQVSELDERISPEPSPEPEEELVSNRAREIFGRQATPDREADPTTSLELVPESPQSAAVPYDDYEAEQERLIDDAGRPRPASPVLRLIEQTRAEREARSDRVAGLFPAPETTEWNVRDITYDRSRRAPASPQ